MDSLLSGSPSRAVYVVAFGLAAVACFVSLRRARRIDDADTRRGLEWVLLLSGGWAAAHVVYLLAPSTRLSLAAYLVGLTVGFAAVGAWLYFCSAYTGRSLHEDATYRRAAIAVFVFVVGLKLTNPIHGLYFTATPTPTPFPHLAVEHSVLHWVSMGLAYALSAVGFFMLFELFTQVGHDTRPLAVLVGLTGLPLVFDIVGTASPRFIDMTYEPIGVALFAVGTLFLFFERFQTVRLAGNVDSPVVFLDEDDEIRDSNAPAHQLFPNLDDAVGEPLEEALPAVADRLASGETLLELSRDGESRYYMVATNPFTFGNTRVGRVLLFTDVTQTERYRREIERQNERLGRFASVVSHDLRNPLSVAYGRVELEQEARATESENLTAAADALDRMGRLIEDVLTLARAGDDIDDRQPVSLSSIAERAWETVDDDGELRIESDATCEADPDRLQQALENLFRNSVEHAGPDVVVTVGSLDDGTGFYVEDDGPGIAPDLREQAFEWGVSGKGGSGLGLAIVETIVEGHGWEITVKESADGGARFEVTGVRS
ncbi:ATP-binding protein [Natronomonas gomsonensis]|uniref:sensor histidine kinase n=1 Tax=Natronomonas gomsonensis TaxID=1046043 RepID=UPI0015C0DC66|nr:ATP-binding protein [Natronomonas gomsonensis]